MARPAKKTSSKSAPARPVAKGKPAPAKPAVKKTVAARAGAKPAKPAPKTSTKAVAKTPAPKPTKAVATVKTAAAPKAPEPKAPARAGKAAAPAKAVAAPAVVPVKRKAPPMSPKEMAAVKAELEEQRATLEKELEDLDLGSLGVSQSELSGEVSFDEEYADAGTFTFERERDFSLSNNIRDLLDKVDSAMKKLAAGTYGLCEHCGNPIDKTRLKALPYSVLCITCKQQEERIR